MRSLVKYKTTEKLSWRQEIIRKVDEYKLPGKTRGAWIKFLTSKKGKTHRKALKDNVTNILISMHEDSIGDETNVIGLINGPPNSGKSRMARTLMKKMQIKAKKDFNIHYPIEFSFYKTVLQKKLKEIIPPGGVIQDEIPREHGKDSNIKKDAVGNLTDSIRQTRTSIVFCTPIKDAETFLNYKLAMFGTNKEKNMLRAWMYQYVEMKPVLIGIVELEFIYDEELEAIYAPLKLDYLKKMKKFAGLVDTIIDKEEINNAIEKYFEILEDKYNLDAVKKHLRSPKKLMDFLELYYDLEGSENFKTKVVNGILVKLYEKELLKGKDPEVAPDQEKPPTIIEKGREISHEEFTLDPRLKQYETIFLELVKEKLWKQSIKEPKGKKIEVFNLKCNEENNLDIHKKLKIATGTVSNYFKEIKLESLGYAGEDAFEEILKKLGFEYERGGNNSPDPDFIIHTLRLIVSFKTYYIYRQNKALSNIAESEFKAAETLGYDLISLGFECYERKFHVFLVKILSSIKKPLSEDFPGEFLNTPSSFLSGGEGDGGGGEGVAVAGSGDGGEVVGEEGGGAHKRRPRRSRKRRGRKKTKKSTLDDYIQPESLEEVWRNLLLI